MTSVHADKSEGQLAVFMIGAEGCGKSVISEENFLEDAYALLDCERVDGMGIGNGLFVYVDQTGVFKRKTLNVPLMRIAMQFGVEAPFFGTGVIVGEDDAGLTVDQFQQLQAITDTFSQEMDDATELRLNWILQQFPEVLPYLE